MQTFIYPKNTQLRSSDVMNGSRSMYFDARDSFDHYYLTPRTPGQYLTSQTPAFAECVYRASKYDPGPALETVFGFPFIGAYDLGGLAELDCLAGSTGGVLGFGGEYAG